MTSQQFLELNNVAQQQLIQEKGVKLGGKTQTDFIYEIYQVDDFYVELKIKQEKGGEVLGLQTFESFSELEPYLEMMELDTDVSDEKENSPSA